MGYELTETLWEPTEKDGTTVPDGDPRARFLVGVAGQTISDEEAERLGLTKGQAQAAPEDPDAVPSGKAVRMGGDVANKAQAGPAASKGKE